MTNKTYRRLIGLELSTKNNEHYQNSKNEYNMHTFTFQYFHKFCA